MDTTSASITTTERTTGRIRGPAAGPCTLTVATPSYGVRGAGARMYYTFAPTPFGVILLAATSHGVTWIGIHDSADYLAAELHTDYAQAAIIHDPTRTAALAEAVVATMVSGAAELDLPMDIRATPFQLRVWRELCAIPRGATRAYGAIASRLGRPTASRAVGHANGSNPTAIIIPCHRVIGASGALTGYRWGVDYKRRLLEHEALGPRAPLDHWGRLRLESRETKEMERSLRKS
jgi:AraC family transcriptional regulator of adaptative response/methylated-DNA-[protein]-cysteine methyltransferase